MTMKMTTKGFNRVRNNLRGAAVNMKRVTNSVVQPWGQNTRAYMKRNPYPSKLPNQRYIRTGNTANRWYAYPAGLGSVEIGNTAKGAKWTIGDASGGGQAKIHYKRWWIGRVVIEGRIPELTKLLSARLERELSK